MRLFSLQLDYTLYTKLSEKEVFERLFAATGYERAPHQQLTDSFNLLAPSPTEKFSGYVAQDSFWLQRAVQYYNRALPEISGVYYPDEHGHTIISFSARLNTIAKFFFVFSTGIAVLVLGLGIWQSFVDISLLPRVLLSLTVIGVMPTIIALYHYFEASWVSSMLRRLLEAKEKTGTTGNP